MGLLPWEFEVYTESSTGGGTPVAANGQLRVCGVKLCNEAGKQIQLRGMSSHGIQWYNQCLNNASLDALATDWKADVLRISMYIQEGGYETNPRLYTDRVHSLIEMASARGMYAIVDWHMLTPGDPNYNLTRARTFFTEIAQRHNAKKNVLYEIANEPNGDSVTWSVIRNYANSRWSRPIRQYDPDAPVLVGTPAWSSLGISGPGDQTDTIRANPVTGTNIMYTFHFYAASHGTQYLNALSRAADLLPMFVSEFGTQEACGDGLNNFSRSQQYIDLLAQKKVSWVNWNFSDDFRTGAVFTTGTCNSGPYTGTTRLKEAGVWVREPDPHRRRLLAHRLLAVDGLAEDVGVAGVLGGLGDDVQQHAPGRPGLLLVPRGLGQRLGRVEVGQADDQFVGLPGDLLVFGQHAFEGVAGQHAELVGPALPVLGGHVGEVAHRLRALDDELGPAAFDRGDVLDQAADAQLAHRGPLPGLLVGQVLGGVPQGGRGACSGSRSGRFVRP